jgi:hypothetical protein
MRFYLHALRATVNGADAAPAYRCSLREQEDRFNKFSFACIALAHDAGNVSVGWIELAPTNDQRDAAQAQWRRQRHFCRQATRRGAD